MGATLDAIKRDPVKVGLGTLLLAIIVLAVTNSVGIFGSKSTISTLIFIFVFVVIATILIRLLSGARAGVGLEFEDFIISLMILAIIFGLIYYGILPKGPFSALPILGG